MDLINTTKFNFNQSLIPSQMFSHNILSNFLQLNNITNQDL